MQLLNFLSKSGNSLPKILNLFQQLPPLLIYGALPVHHLLHVVLSEEVHGPDLVDDIPTQRAPCWFALVHLLPVLKTSLLKHVATGGNQGGHLQQGHVQKSGPES